MKRCLVAVAVATVLVLSAAHASAAMLLFDVLLDGLQEVPPVATPGYGSGSLTLNDSTGDFTINGTFDALIGTTINAHIHGPGNYGVNAAAIVNLTFDIGVTSGTFSGAGTFNLAQMTDLKAGLYYVNVHTSFKPGGEIRGQITPVPEPGGAVLALCGGAALLCAARRRRATRC